MGNKQKKWVCESGVDKSDEDTFETNGLIHATSLCRALAATIYDAKISKVSSVDFYTRADRSRRA
jgi:hypothetical protein